MLLIALGAISWLVFHTNRLALVRGPTVRNSTLARSGLGRSLAALRGWVVLGDGHFRTERSLAWQKEIRPAFIELDRLSGKWTVAEHVHHLHRAQRLLDDLEEREWWTQDVARRPGNEPARALYSKEIEPTVRRMQDAITRMIEDEGEAVAEDRHLDRLRHMADFRFHLIKSQSKTLDFVNDGNTDTETEIRSALNRLVRSISVLMDLRIVLPATLPDRLSWMNDKLAAYRRLTEELITYRQRRDWNRAQYLLSEKVNPIARELGTLLETLSEAQDTLMAADANVVTTRLATVIIVLCILIVSMAITAYGLSISSAAKLTDPIHFLVAATRDMAVGHLKIHIPIRSADELGQLTDSFNRMRRALAEATRDVDMAYNRLTSLVECAVDAIITIDARGIIESVNDAAWKLFGYSRDELVGHNVKLLVPSPDRERHDDCIKAFVRTGEAKIIGIGREVIAIKKDGRHFPVHLSISEARVEDAQFFTGIVYDLTDRKALEKELEDRAEELSRSNDDLQQFAYVASHDLQEPLRAVSGFTQ